MAKRFIKKIEDFVCENCGIKVTGTGYTNHCPKCLFSKHVDVNPGDREETCGGLMPAIDFEVVKGKYVLIHKCEKCGEVRKNKFSENDDINTLLSLSQAIAKKLYI